MSDEIEFVVASKAPPTVELNDSGLYVRFKSGVEVARTVVQSEWPHIAVDLDANQEVVGIEHVPTPSVFSIGLIPKIIAEAKVQTLTAFDPADLQIQNLCAAV